MTLSQSPVSAAAVVAMAALSALPAMGTPSPLTDDILKEKIADWFSGGDAKTAVETTYGKIEDFDVSQVTNMADLFQGKATFDADISKWNTGLVTDMTNMFKGATAFSADLSNWKTTQVTGLTDVFTDSCPTASTVKTEAAGTVTAETLKTFGKLNLRCSCDTTGEYFFGATCEPCDEKQNAVPGTDVCNCKTAFYGLDGEACTACPSGYVANPDVAAGRGDEATRCLICDDKSNKIAQEVTDKDAVCVCKKGAYGSGVKTCDSCGSGYVAKSGVAAGNGDKAARCQSSDATTNDPRFAMILLLGAHYFRNFYYAM